MRTPETPLAWHGVLAPEGVWSGDGRRFALDSLRFRDLPLPLTWQRATGDGHDGSTVVARIDTHRAGAERDGVNLMQADGTVHRHPGRRRGGRADRRVRPVRGQRGRRRRRVRVRRGVRRSVTFTSARIASAAMVTIPAFAEAYSRWARGPTGGRSRRRKGEDEMRRGGGVRPRLPRLRGVRRGQGPGRGGPRLGAGGPEEVGGRGGRRGQPGHQRGRRGDDLRRCLGRHRGSLHPGAVEEVHRAARLRQATRSPATNCRSGARWRDEPGPVCTPPPAGSTRSTPPPRRSPAPPGPCAVRTSSSARSRRTS